MSIIKTQQDFDVLRRASSLPNTILGPVEIYLNQLKLELEDETESEFHLGRNGYIVVLEAGDNLRDLGNVRLHREDGGLQVYKIAVLYDNDYVMTFFTQTGAHNEEVEQWLKDQAERN